MGGHMEIMKSATQRRGFTLVELLVVIIIIAILMALFLGVGRGVQQSARYNRAKSEIATIEVALTRFEADYGFSPPIYEIQTNTFYEADPRTARYSNTSRALYFALTGRTSFNATNTNVLIGTNNYPTGRDFITFKESQVFGLGNNATEYLSYFAEAYTNNFDSATFTGIRDPWGNPYGYYFNPTSGRRSLKNEAGYDLWSTGGQTNNASGYTNKWVANWPN